MTGKEADVHLLGPRLLGLGPKSMVGEGEVREFRVAWGGWGRWMVWAVY